MHSRTPPRQANPDRDGDRSARRSRSVAVLMFIAARFADVAAGSPSAMGAGIGALTGVFFGVWAGVVARFGDMEEVEHEELDLEPVRTVSTRS